jgi:mannosyl-oligosaccharide alpha-1,2-mannosidase
MILKVFAILHRSFSLEFAYLSHKTVDDKYFRAAKDIFHHVTKKTTRQSQVRKSILVPSSWNVMNGTPLNQWTSLGSGSDSFYEYLIKVPLLLRMGINDDILGYQQMFHLVIHESFLSKSSGHILQSHCNQTKGDNWFFPVDNRNTYQHLLCYLPGTVLLAGNHTKKYYSEYLNLAERLIGGCHSTYEQSKTGLGAERIQIKGNNILPLDKGYYLRPEFVESLFILYRMTKDDRYQEIAWNVFMNIEKHCKTDIGYSSLLDVDDTKERKDEQPSFFLGETLKYLLLTFAPDDYVDLDDFVFTTEAHPLRKVDTDTRDSTCNILENNRIRQPISITFSMAGNAIIVSTLILCWRSKTFVSDRHKKVH